MGTIKRIMVATDLSEITPRLYAVAAGLAGAGAEIVVAHIADRDEYVEMIREGHHLGVDEYLERFRSTILHVAGKAISSGTPVRTDVMLRERSVAQDLLGLARELNVDLIVMGTHGRTGLRRVLLGSVAEEVVRYARIPVLVVPTLSRAAAPAVAAGTATEPASHGR